MLARPSQRLRTRREAVPRRRAVPCIPDRESWLSVSRLRISLPRRPAPSRRSRSPRPPPAPLRCRRATPSRLLPRSRRAPSANTFCESTAAHARHQRRHAAPSRSRSTRAPAFAFPLHSLATPVGHSPLAAPGPWTTIFVPPDASHVQLHLLHRPSRQRAPPPRARPSAVPRRGGRAPPGRFSARSSLVPCLIPLPVSRPVRDPGKESAGARIGSRYASNSPLPSPRGHKGSRRPRTAA